MLSLLCGQLTESTGEILFRGKPLREHIDFHIGYMPQQDQLFEWRNIYGNVTLGLEIQKKLTADSLRHPFDKNPPRSADFLYYIYQKNCRHQPTVFYQS